MNRIKDFPSPIRRKLFLTVLLGGVCLLIGLAMFLFAKDRIMLLLSGAVCIACLLRAWSLFQTVRRGEYETVEGVCTAITPKPLRKYRKISVTDDDGNESALLLGKQAKIRIGKRYRFYFKKTQRITVGNEYFDMSLSSDCFLGFEEAEEG